jgi:hypothetical protein
VNRFYYIIAFTKLLSVLRYYDECNTTNPSLLPFDTSLAFNKFSQCESTYANVNCLDAKYGYPSLPPSLLKSAIQPSGTASYSNQAGSLTSSPYGSSAVWYFFGTASSNLAATAIAIKAGNQGSGNTGGSSSGSSNGVRTSTN